MTEINRRKFFGGSFFGLTALAAPEVAPLEESDQIFEYVHNVPLVPVDSWFNQPRHTVWNRTQIYSEIPDLHSYKHPQLYFPRDVMEKAIADIGTISACDGVLSISDHVSIAYEIVHGGDIENKNGKLRYTDIAAFFITKLRIERCNDNQDWLMGNLKFVKPDVAPEFQKLTTLRKKEIINWMDRQPDSCVVDFMPFGCGKISIHDRGTIACDSPYSKITKQYGVRFEEYYLITMSMLVNHGNPRPLRWFWKYYDKQDPVTYGSLGNENVRGNIYKHELDKLEEINMNRHIK